MHGVEGGGCAGGFPGGAGGEEGAIGEGGGFGLEHRLQVSRQRLM
tara:strand:+ start:359 stop:493 length:135 start_codon:yes stop_codon:yes gene_type:complete